MATTGTCTVKSFPVYLGGGDTFSTFSKLALMLVDENGTNERILLMGKGNNGSYLNPTSGDYDFGMMLNSDAQMIWAARYYDLDFISTAYTVGVMTESYAYMYMTDSYGYIARLLLTDGL